MQSVPDSPQRRDGWESAIFAELQRLNGQQHERKKKDTIIALVDVTLAGVSEETVWGRGETCARSTWHEKWKKDPLIADVLERSRRAANDWRDNLAANTLAEAAELLAIESLDSVKTAARLRDWSEDDRVRLQAAFGILDRADKMTASKASTELSVSGDLAEKINRVYGDIEGGNDDE